MNRRRILLTGLGAAASATLAACGGASASENIASAFPDVSDNRSASPEVVALLTAFFKAKTRRDLDGTMSFFSRQLVTYFDATLGLDLAGFEAVKNLFAQSMPKWPDGSASYPTRIIGDMTGATVLFTNTPELFGGEIRAIASISFSGGKIDRWVDYWDSRAWDNAFGFTKSGATDSHASAVVDRSAPVLKTAATSLISALAGTNAAAAAALFSYDAVYEDLTLHAQIQGRAAIERYFSRSLARLPHGRDVTLRHVVGGDQGGGVEWIAGNATAVKTGVSAVVLNDAAQITRWTNVYDGALLGADLPALAALSVEV